MIDLYPVAFVIVAMIARSTFLIVRAERTALTNAMAEIKLFKEAHDKIKVLEAAQIEAAEKINSLIVRAGFNKDMNT